MSTYCGADCSKCGFNGKCRGCSETCGKPFGGACIAAEYIKIGGNDMFCKFKKQIMSEFNDLKIDGLPKITELYCLCGSLVNMEYTLPNGTRTKFLKDENIYLGTQAICKETGTCFGLVADMGFLLVCTYEEDGANPELIVYKRR